MIDNFVIISFLSFVIFSILSNVAETTFSCACVLIPFLSFVWFCLSVFYLFVIVIIITCICSGDEPWWCIPSGSLPLYCFSLQLLFFLLWLVSTVSSDQYSRPWNRSSQSIESIDKHWSRFVRLDRFQGLQYSREIHELHILLLHQATSLDGVFLPSTTTVLLQFAITVFHCG